MRTAVGGTAQPMLRDERSRAVALARWFVAAAGATAIVFALGQRGAAADETVPTPDPLSGLLNGLVGQVAPPLSTVVNTVTPVISPVVQPVTDVLAPVVQPVVDATSEQLAPLLPILEPLSPLTEPLVPIVEAVEPLLELSGPVVDVVAQVLPGGSAPSSPAAPPTDVPSAAPPATAGPKATAGLQATAGPQVTPGPQATSDVAATSPVVPGVASSPAPPDLTASAVAEATVVEPASMPLPSESQPVITAGPAPSRPGASAVAAVSEAVRIVTTTVDTGDAMSVPASASLLISRQVTEFPTLPAAPADWTPLGYVAGATSSIARVVDGAFGSSAAVLSSSPLLALAFAGWVLLAGLRPLELARGAPPVPPA